MELTVRKYHSLRSALTLKWASRVGTIFFLGLAIFFLNIFFSYPYIFYRSFFSQLRVLLDISSSSVVYSQFRTIVYIFSLGFGLLLTATFLKNTKNRQGAKGIAAISCAWLGFVLQVSREFILQWTPIAVWIHLDLTLLVLFITTLILLATSLLFLTNYGWALRFGYLVCWGFLLFNLVGLILIMRYFVWFLGPFPTLMMVMVIISSASIYYLGKFGLVHPNGKKCVYEGRRFSQKLKRFFTSSKILAMIFVSVLILDSIAFVLPDNNWISKGSATNDFYCGISFCGTTTAEAKLLIDRVKNYTNVFVVQSLPISENEAVLNEVCNYAIDSGLHVIVYFRWFDQYWQACWLDTAKQRWGEKFLGVYLYDEPGGLQLDRASYMRWLGGQPRNYSEAAESYIRAFRLLRYRADMQMLKMRKLRTFTSDYALYWFNYKAGYDVLFAEFGWNYSRQLNVALCRGAAKVQNKDWGVMITWTYNDPPYIESGDELYNDMILAYNNGANYILVFDHPYISNSTYGILKEEHFEASEQFWQYAQDNPRNNLQVEERVAFVLPEGFGYGFRGPDDKIWGIWEADALSLEISHHLGGFLEEYGSNLDIIYDDDIKYSELYSKYIFWNGTISVP